MKRKLFAGSLGNRLLLYLTLFMMLPLFVAGLLLYRESDSHLSDSAMRLTKQIMTNATDNVDEVLSSMQGAARAIYFDDVVQELLGAPAGTEAQRQELARALGDRLGKIADIYSKVDGIYLLLDNGVTAKSRYYELLPEQPLRGAPYADIRNHAEPRWILGDGSAVVDNKGASVLTMATSLGRQADGSPCGLIVVEVKQSLLRSLLAVDFGARGTVFLMDASDEVVVCRQEYAGALEDERRAAAEVTVGPTIEVLDRGDRYMLCDRVPSNGWTVVGVVYKRFLQEDSRKILRTVCAIAAVSFLLNIVLSRCLREFELRPIREMMRFVKQVELGDFSRRIEVVRPDEIGALAESIGTMAVCIDNLFETVKADQERYRISEYKALQAQINPHFLYNTLDSINWMIREGNGARAIEMVDALTTFFRIGLSRGKDLIPLRDELQHAKSYLKIQKIRYDKKFDYYLRCDPGLEDCCVPKLIVQPLIENAIYHGIKPKQRRGTILISTLDLGDTLQIEVVDDGVGIVPARLDALRAALTRTGEVRAESYGLVNVNDRVRILYGKGYGLTLTGGPGAGTSVVIRLPKRTEEDGHV